MRWLHSWLPVVLISTVTLSCSGAGSKPPSDGAAATIVIGSKNFTEQVLLGEILATLVESRTSLRVDRRFDLGGTFVCHKALTAGELDLYVEYTGTALSAILSEPPGGQPDAVFTRVAAEYARRFDLTWLPPLGFNNSFAMVVRSEDAVNHSLSRISDLARVADTFRAGFGYEFIERADGYEGLAATYWFKFLRRPREMDLGLIYRALAGHEVDVVVGNSTDGMIDSLGLVVLEDDLRYFPPYDAAPVARAATLALHPELRQLLGQLGGRITAEQMRAMNREADIDHRSSHAIAVEFLETAGLYARR